MKKEKGQSLSEKGTFQRSIEHLGISLPHKQLKTINLKKLKSPSFFSNLQKEGQRPITGRSLCLK